MYICSSLFVFFFFLFPLYLSNKNDDSTAMLFLQNLRQTLDDLTRSGFSVVSMTDFNLASTAIEWCNLHGFYTLYPVFFVVHFMFELELWTWLNEHDWTSRLKYLLKEFHICFAWYSELTWCRTIIKGTQNYKWSAWKSGKGLNRIVTENTGRKGVWLHTTLKTSLKEIIFYWILRVN